MYAEGQGVQKDCEVALEWYFLAAEQEYAEAQYNLGMMYAEGQGVQKNYVLAHMWLNLADSKGHKDARESRDILEDKMSNAQIEDAKEQVRKW